MSGGRATLDGACRCGAVRFRAAVDPATARRCDCSMCRMRGAVAVSCAPDDFAIREGGDALRRRTFGTHVAQHWFCGRCGIHTHHRRRADPDELGVNLACLAGRTPFLPEVIVNDGIHHPSDGAAPRVAGVLRWEPS